MNCSSAFVLKQDVAMLAAYYFLVTNVNRPTILSQTEKNNLPRLPTVHLFYIFNE